VQLTAAPTVDLSPLVRTTTGLFYAWITEVITMDVRYGIGF
jgi:hypothetical protein